MKSLIDFIRATITGGILFLLPVILLIIVFTKAYHILHKITIPLSKRLPDIIFGFNGSFLLTIVLIILICFVSGLVFRSKIAKLWVKKLEDNLLINVPGYVLIKSITSSTMGKTSDTDMVPILIKDDNSWSLAFLVEGNEKLSTVFIPDAPKHDAGEVKIIPSELIQKLDVSVNVFSRSIKNYGKGASKWVK